MHMSGGERARGDERAARASGDTVYRCSNVENHFVGRVSASESDRAGLPRAPRKASVNVLPDSPDSLSDYKLLNNNLKKKW